MEFVTLSVLFAFVAVAVRFLRAAREEDGYVDDPEGGAEGFDADQITDIFEALFDQAKRPDRVERTSAGPWLALPIGGPDDPLGPIFPTGIAVPTSLEQRWGHDVREPRPPELALHLELCLWHDDGRREPLATVRIPADRFVDAGTDPLQVTLELDLIGNLSGRVTDPVLGTTVPLQVQMHAVAPVDA